VIPDLAEIEVGQLTKVSKPGFVGFLVDGDVGHAVNVEIEFVRVTRTLGN
jgi:hypothetical protein